MNFTCQHSARDQLEVLAQYDKHSILIEGPAGCGKSYMAKQFAVMKCVDDFQIIEPNVQSIRDAIDACYTIDTPVVLCIENLDKGVAAASYTLLKFLEEPSDNVYIVVTCRNRYHVPDTIISRSVCVTTSPPIMDDLNRYASSKDATKFNILSCSYPKLWACCSSFIDADIMLGLSADHLKYFDDISDMLKFNSTVSDMMWKFGHYPDNTEAPVELVVRYIIEVSDSFTVRKAGMQCLTDIQSGRVASHAALGRFLFECKYIQ